MGDVHCAVCGEPWDAYGVSFGDMLPWEAKLFRLGAGCPSCEGKSNYDSDEMLERHLQDRVIDVAWDDDPDPVGEATTKPKWEKPEPQVIWTCVGCGVQAVMDPDIPEELQWYGGQEVHYYRGSGPFKYSKHPDADEAPEQGPSFKVGEKPYCPGCATTCSKCGKTVLKNTEGMDPYDEGYSFCSERSYRTVCLSCFEDEMAEGEE